MQRIDAKVSAKPGGQFVKPFAKLLLVVLLFGLAHLCRANSDLGWTVHYESDANAVTIIGPSGATWHKKYDGQDPNAHGGGGTSADPPSSGGGGTTPGGGTRPSGGTSPGGGGGSAGSVGPGSVDCHGAITATITWDMTKGPRPSCVIIKETATASWAGSSGSGSDGLGGTAVNTGGGELAGGGSCSTVRYTVKSDLTNDPPPMTNAPIANAALPAPTGGLQGASANVSYKVEVFTVAITLRGTTVVNDIDYILTGQQITASVGGATLATTPAPTWSISTGADRCFGDFVVSDTTDNTTNPATTISQGKSEVKALVTNLPDFQFYTKKDGEVKVKCVATINVPDGTTKAVTLESKSVNSERPTSTWNIRDGTVVFFDESFGASLGQFWNATITLPPSFGQSSGQGAFCQIASPSRRYGTANPTKKFVNPMFGLPGLDNAFPYTAYQSKGLNSITGADEPSEASPFIYERDDVLYDMLLSRAQDSFITYLMFKPAATVQGQATQWVPLKKYTWSWGAEVTRTNAGVFSWTKTVLQQPTHTGPMEEYNHPIWIRKHLNHAVYVEEP